MKNVFQITLVVLVVVVTVVFLTFLMIGMVNVLAPHNAETSGIVVWSGGVSFRALNLLLLAAAFVIAGLYLYLRRRRLHR
jgi:hypothetical protein